MAAPAPAAKRTKLMERASNYMSEGQHYEAFMLYKGQIARRGPSAAVDGVSELCRAAQGKLAGELAVAVVESGQQEGGLLFVVDALVGAADEVKAEVLGRVLEAAARRRGDDKAPEKDEAHLHAQMCGVLVAQKRYGDAQLHAVLGNDATCFRPLVDAWAAASPAAETPLFHLRLYLMLLVNGLPARAAEFVSGGGGEEHALSQHLRFVQTALHKKSKALFDHVVGLDGFKSYVAADPMLGKLLEVCGVSISARIHTHTHARTPTDCRHVLHLWFQVLQHGRPAPGRCCCRSRDSSCAEALLARPRLMRYAKKFESETTKTSIPTTDSHA